MHHSDTVLPAIPAKRYFTIGEVSELCGVKPYVLRYWEQEFTQLRPMKRRGNRRYYQHHEVLLIRRIRELLYDQGFTISGARNRLLESAHDESPLNDVDAADLGHLDALAAAVMAGNAATSAARAALDVASSAGIRVLPRLPDNPSPVDVREELMAIRDLLTV